MNEWLFLGWFVFYAAGAAWASHMIFDLGFSQCCGVFLLACCIISATRLTVLESIYMRKK